MSVPYYICPGAGNSCCLLFNTEGPDYVPPNCTCNDDQHLDWECYSNFKAGYNIKRVQIKIKWESLIGSIIVRNRTSHTANENSYRDFIDQCAGDPDCEQLEYDRHKNAACVFNVGDQEDVDAAVDGWATEERDALTEFCNELATCCKDNAAEEPAECGCPIPDVVALTIPPNPTWANPLCEDNLPPADTDCLNDCAADALSYWNDRKADIQTEYDQAIHRYQRKVGEAIFDYNRPAADPDKIDCADYCLLIQIASDSLGYRRTDLNLALLVAAADAQTVYQRCAILCCD